MLIPYDKGSITSYLCEKGQIEEMIYEETGTRLRGRFKREDLERYRNYEVTD